MTAKKKSAGQPDADDPLAAYPSDVEGGKWVHDAETGDVRFEHDDPEEAPAEQAPPATDVEGSK